ncbi:hypothetical protein [Algoriphagus sediminis]|uniref:Uncharacterized protein n=1 Tax=Algoriphagus sediminis TaxID=3057113 RepID=A0ABT7YFH0_9BACT|nr:hypothetical protein [Algoriphagus sediminis]MDN3205270.1 hypothetical protein [Algoriphagus sediminis]
MRFQIKKYAYDIRTPRIGVDNEIQNQSGSIMELYGQNDELLAYIYFERRIRRKSQSLSNNLNSRPPLVSYDISDLPAILDLLRNESPVYLDLGHPFGGYLTTKEGNARDSQE